MPGIPGPVPAGHDGGQPAGAPALALLPAGPAGVVGVRQPDQPAQYVRLVVMPCVGELQPNEMQGCDIGRVLLSVYKCPRRGICFEQHVTLRATPAGKSRLSATQVGMEELTALVAHFTLR